MQIRLDTARRAETISPLLFGHNLEHTRSCVWQGLSAQLLRNRKFAGRPERDGQPQQWYTLGPVDTFFRLEWTCLMARRLGETTYTRHFDPDVRRRAMDSQRLRIVCLRAGKPCGVGQKDLPLAAGGRYDGRVTLQSDVAMTVTIALRDGDGAPFFRHRVRVRPGAWREFAFACDAPATTADARIEITTATAGSLWLGAVSLLPSDHFHGMRRDVVARLKQLRPTLLRWPGGNFAGDYCWKDGLLPVDQRAPLMSYEPIETQPHSGGFDFHEMATDDFIALCREVGAAPFLSVNIAWDSPEACAEWVAYCNADARHPWGLRRIARGHREPHGVRYWSLGNEIGYTHMEGPGRPDAYARKAAACIVAMRAVDPGLVFISSGNWDLPEWIDDGMKRVAPLVDHISHHRYTPVLQDFHGRAAAASLRALVDYPRRVREDFRHIRDQLDRCTPPGRKVGISFDEWNVWYTWYARPRVLDGVHAACMQHLILREAARYGVTIGSYFEPVNEGAIRIDAHTAQLTTVGRVLAMLADHQGRMRMRLPAALEGTDIDALASLDVAGGVLVTVANRNPTRPVAVNLAVAAPVTILRARVLSGATPYAVAFVERPLAAVIGPRGRVAFTLPPFAVARLDLLPVPPGA